jgi:hypothetical protein
LSHDFSINEMHLELRIGIGTGPVVAGVVGKKKFIYDLWGDTVNIASRVTTEGIPGMVQVDERTYRRLQRSFNFQEPRTIFLKGKGNMVVHHLIGRRTAGSASRRRLARPRQPPQLEAHLARDIAGQSQFVAAAFRLSSRVIEPDPKTALGGHGRAQQVAQDKGGQARCRYRRRVVPRRQR